MAKALAPDADERTTAQGLFLSADAYLEAVAILVSVQGREGHAAMPVRFLLFHAAELYLKAFLRVSGLSVSEVFKLGHRFDKLFDAAIESGFRPAVWDYEALLQEQANDQIMRARYITTGSQISVPLAQLQEAVCGLRKDLRHHPEVASSLVFRPWDKEDGNHERADLMRVQRLAD